ncbi:MAG TPA: hypothetical protein VMU83_02800 [Hanamia sp.]|nr:hypothetical protein [Hanamia sp.]
MQKLFLFLIPCSALIFGSCHSSKNSIIPYTGDSVNTQSIFPVTNFLKGQLLQIDSMQITPLKIMTINGKKDSIWLDKKDIRPAAAPFLTPLIDSTTMSSLFSEKSFFDQTINSYTFSYDPKVKLPDSINLTHWDVYMSPQTNKVTRIYMVKEKTENNADIITQLTWFSNEWFTITTISQSPGKKPEIKEEKMKWNFDE